MRDVAEFLETIAVPAQPASEPQDIIAALRDAFPHFQNEEPITATAGLRSLSQSQFIAATFRPPIAEAAE